MQAKNSLSEAAAGDCGTIEQILQHLQATNSVKAYLLNRQILQLDQSLKKIKTHDDISSVDQSQIESALNNFNDLKSQYLVILESA